MIKKNQPVNQFCDPPGLFTELDTGFAFGLKRCWKRYVHHFRVVSADD